MVTVAEVLINELRKTREEFERLEEKMEEIYMNLEGMELDGSNHFYAIIDCIDGEEVRLYCEKENGFSYYDVITLDELLRIIRSFSAK